MSKIDELDELLLDLSVKVAEGLSTEMIMFKLGQACGMVSTIKEESEDAELPIRECVKDLVREINNSNEVPDSPTQNRVRFSKGGIE